MYVCMYACMYVCNSWTKLRMSTPLFVGSCLQVTWWALGQLKEETFASNDNIDCLQSAVSLKIRLVLISSSAIGNHEVVVTIRDWDKTEKRRTADSFVVNKTSVSPETEYPIGQLHSCWQIIHLSVVRLQAVKIVNVVLNRTVVVDSDWRFVSRWYYILWLLIWLVNKVIK